MYKDLLPIGSVVQLKDTEAKLVITGRIISDERMERIFDYVGVLYPLGISADNDQYFFNRETIETVYHVGYIGEEELAFKREVLDKLGELEIRDGKIVEK